MDDTIQLSQETCEKLMYVGKKGETYDDIISRLFYDSLRDDVHGTQGTSEYETQRLLRVAKTRTDEELQETIRQAEENLEELKGRREEDGRGRGEYFQRAIQENESKPLDELVWLLEEHGGNSNAFENVARDVLIDKKLAETELRRRGKRFPRS